MMPVSELYPIIDFYSYEHVGDEIWYTVDPDVTIYVGNQSEITAHWILRHMTIQAFIANRMNGEN